jgi:hypothetical protein
VNAFVRGVNWTMCGLFLMSLVVQWNDPDPVRWMAIYGAALAVCLVVALRGRIVAGVPVLVAVIALLWSVATIASGPAITAYSHVFDAWEMKSISVEEAREATGLLIVAVWMLVVVLGERGGSWKK